MESSMRTGVADSMLSLIGGTPLVRLDKIRREEGLKCNLLAKCEFFNAGGSVKDRIALRMVEEAEKAGRIMPGKTVLVEPSSGNTGIGLALVAAVKGYQLIVTMPEKMSQEKENTMKALGAKIIRTPTEAAHDSPLSNIGLAKRLVRPKAEGGLGLPNAVMLDQYGNDGNPDAHYYTTAPEIIRALEAPSSNPSTSQCDVLVAGVGTGGTITGLAKRLREHNSAVHILGVDPRGSVLARPETLNTLEAGDNGQYKIEGVGYDFVPDVLKHQHVTSWIKSSDTTSFDAAKRLMRTEGLLCGGSAGSVLSGALEYLHSEEGWRRYGSQEGVNVVILLADGIRNYVTSNWLTEDQVDCRVEDLDFGALDLDGPQPETAERAQLHHANL